MNGGTVAGIIGLATLVVVASIAYQAFTKPNAPGELKTVASFGSNTLSTLFK